MRLSEFIEANVKEIAEEWEGFARGSSSSAGGMNRLVLRDEIEQILEAILHDMRRGQTSSEQAEKGKGRGPTTGLDTIGHSHALQRVELGFQLDQVVSEFRALRASVLRLWEASGPELSASDVYDVTRFNETIDPVLMESLCAYTVERDHYREQFLAIVGHDLRNPLGAITMAASHMLGAGRPNEPHAQAASRILISAERMRRLLDDLLDLTRVRLGTGIPLTRAPMDLATTCKQVVDELAAFHPDRALHFDASGDLRGTWDADRLAQVLSNLIGNAIQHGAATKPVRISARPDGSDVVLTVCNEGHPIPPEVLGRIFEPLVQAEGQGQAKPHASLGLGLFIVREIVLSHGGDVSVTSSEEQGTTFTVRLPRSKHASRAPFSGSQSPN